MGLDISLHKAFHSDDKNLNYHKLEGTNYCYTLKEKGVEDVESVNMGKFLSKRINTYLDFENTIVGDSERYRYCGFTANKEVIYEFEDLQHELQEMKNKYCKIGIDLNNIKLSKKERQLLRKYGYKGNFKKKDARGEVTYWPVVSFLYNAVKVRLNQKDIPTYDVEDTVLYGKEIGYQRKGLNSKFYQDYIDGRIGYFVFTRAELEMVKEEYCDEPYEHEYGNGEKEIINPKEKFQHNIIDDFVEGECFVTFDW